MTDFFSGIFDGVSELFGDVATSAEDFYNGMDDILKDNGFDIAKGAKSLLGEGGSSGASARKGVDVSKYVDIRDTPSGVANQVSAASRKSEAVGSVDMKAIHREWSQRMREFAQATQNTKVM